MVPDTAEVGQLPPWPWVGVWGSEQLPHQALALGGEVGWPGLACLASAQLTQIQH